MLTNASFSPVAGDDATSGVHFGVEFSYFHLCILLNSRIFTRVLCFIKFVMNENIDTELLILRVFFCALFYIESLVEYFLTFLDQRMDQKRPVTPMFTKTM